MKNYEDIVAEAVRIEYEHQSGQLFIVFKVVDGKHKDYIKNNWTKI